MFYWLYQEKFKDGMPSDINEPISFKQLCDSRFIKVCILIQGHRWMRK